ncbi:uncharacterized protein [Littorina saxatilis]|uniref:uncharacterized protein n=1 Tax=Littorina saxatilis TaxID=31220 RepID=UPI0038B63326
MTSLKRLPLILLLLQLLCFFCSNTLSTTPATVTLAPLLPVLTVNKTGVIVTETEMRSLTNVLQIACTQTNGIHTSVNLASMSPSGPCGGCFSLLPCAQGTNFCLMYAVGQGTLNATVAPRYQLTFNCSDSDGRWVTTNADVFIQPNSLPFFDPATYPGLKVEGEISQSQGVTVEATDKEGDALEYSMVTIPHTDALEIDRLTGEIGVAQGKIIKSECRNHYAARVFVKDSHHSQIVGPIAVSLEVSDVDQNQRPVITNLKGELRVREDEAVDSVVLEMGVVDEGDYVNADTMTYTITTEPHSAASLFKLVKTG